MLPGEQDIVDIDEESMKTRTVHFGDGYKVDNRTIWNKLKVVLIDKPGYITTSVYLMQPEMVDQLGWHSLCIMKMSTISSTYVKQHSKSCKQHSIEEKLGDSPLRNM